MDDKKKSEKGENSAAEENPQTAALTVHGLAWVIAAR
jgi:hypothetical protein